LETGTQIIMLWDRPNTSRGFLRLRTPGATAWLHEPDGTVRPVSAFDGRTIPHVEVDEGAIPLLYEVRPSRR
jgi:hypothetical protein